MSDVRCFHGQKHLRWHYLLTASNGSMLPDCSG